MSEQLLRGRENLYREERRTIALLCGDEILRFYRTPSGKIPLHKLSYWSRYGSSCGQSPYASNKEAANQKKVMVGEMVAPDFCQLGLTVQPIPTGSTGSAVGNPQVKRIRHMVNYVLVNFNELLQLFITKILNLQPFQVLLVLFSGACQCVLVQLFTSDFNY